MCHSFILDELPRYRFRVNTCTTWSSAWQLLCVQCFYLGFLTVIHLPWTAMHPGREWTHKSKFNNFTSSSHFPSSDWNYFSKSQVLCVIFLGDIAVVVCLHLIHGDGGVILKIVTVDAVWSLFQKASSINTSLLSLEVRAAICCLLLGCCSLLSFWPLWASQMPNSCHWIITKLIKHCHSIYMVHFRNEKVLSMKKKVASVRMLCRVDSKLVFHYTSMICKFTL